MENSPKYKNLNSGDTPSVDDKKLPANYYIDPKQFEADLAEHAVTQCPIKLNEICERYFYELAPRVIARFGCGYACFDDLVQDAVEACVKRIGRFDRSRGTPFNFFQKVITNRVRDTRRKEGRRASREISLREWEENPEC